MKKRKFIFAAVFSFFLAINLCDSWILSAARMNTDFCEKITEFPHIGKVLLLEFLVFVQPPGRQLPFSEKWPFIALQTKSFLFVAAHVKLRSSFSYVYGRFEIQAIVNLEFALLLQK